MQKYLQDRRVIGVSRILPSIARTSVLNGILQYEPLVEPALLRHEIPSAASQRTVTEARYNAARILAGRDDRVVVIVGPCSIHSPEQAIEYAKLLKSKIPQWSNLLIIMRAYL